MHESILPEKGYDASAAVDADALDILYLLSGRPRAPDRGQTVLAPHNGRVAHRPADVRHCRGDVLENRSPTRIGDLADQYVAFAQATNLVNRLHDTGRTL